MDKYDCPKCLGVGEILPRHEHFGVQVCPHCKGFGKLDWVECITGKKHPVLSYQAMIKKYMEDNYGVV